MRSNEPLINDLILFIVATAGQEDEPSDRYLGYIHIIKYLYLADLAFAQHNRGKIYTGIPWKFHHFGPWSPEAYSMIDAPLETSGATAKRIESKYGEEDFVRWYLRDDQLFISLANKLPLPISQELRKYIHNFTNVTETLLDFVYKTKPMLRAAPGEFLDFGADNNEGCGDEANQGKISDLFSNLSGITFQSMPRLSRAEFKSEAKNLLETKKRENAKIRRSYPPRYDDIFFNGVKTLDELAGEKIPDGTGIVSFSDDIWRSKARFDPDLS